MSQRKKSVVSGIVLIIVIQSLLLVFMIVNRQMILSSDNIVVLETRPIDPRSLFRGDYVRLNYEINTLQLHELSGDRSYRINDTIYVVLEKKGEYWGATATYLEIPKLLDGQFIIQGVVKRVNNRHWNNENTTFSDITSLSVNYGIENYFVPEGEGLKLERPKPGDKVTLEIALDYSGKAAIKTLLLNGVPQYHETVF